MKAVNVICQITVETSFEFEKGLMVTIETPGHSSVGSAEMYDIARHIAKRLPAALEASGEFFKRTAEIKDAPEAR